MASTALPFRAEIGWNGRPSVVYVRQLFQAMLGQNDGI